MNEYAFDIATEDPDDGAAIEALLDQGFGPDRKKKTAYRLRDGRACVQGLSFTAKARGELVGTIRFWPIVIGDCSRALLLGPLAVAGHFSDHRCGIALMEHGLERARETGFELVLLVGDLSYYGKVGFEAVPEDRLIMPGPVDPGRLLLRELAPGALERISGEVGPGPAG